jgi:hypothetical protein
MPSLLLLTSTEFMIVIFLSKADITKKYAYYMKCIGVLPTRVRVIATYQQHGTYYYKITQINISALASFTQLRQANVITGQQ